MSAQSFQMEDLFNLNLFVKIGSDFEKRQYQILEALKRIRRQFRSNRIYPELGKMVDLYRDLKSLSDRVKELRDELPKRIKEIDLQKMQIIREPVYVDPANLADVERMVDWGLPLVKKTMDEGVAVFEYVDENTKIERVGIMPQYQDEGYVFVPDYEQRELKLYHFEISIFHSSEDTYRSLRTRIVDRVTWGGALQSPNAIKLDLIEKYREMPNPATFSVDTEVECPYRETLFPVAKRKLVRHLST